ncbi:unnamed protein product, partial [Trichogramma brassicae]
TYEWYCFGSASQHVGHQQGKNRLRQQDRHLCNMAAAPPNRTEDRDREQQQQQKGRKSQVRAWTTEKYTDAGQTEQVARLTPRRSARCYFVAAFCKMLLRGRVLHDTTSEPYMILYSAVMFTFIMYRVLVEDNIPKNESSAKRAKSSLRLRSLAALRCVCCSPGSQFPRIAAPALFSWSNPATYTPNLRTLYGTASRPMHSRVYPCPCAYATGLINFYMYIHGLYHAERERSKKELRIIQNQLLKAALNAPRHQGYLLHLLLVRERERENKLNVVKTTWSKYKQAHERRVKIGDIRADENLKNSDAFEETYNCRNNCIIIAAKLLSVFDELKYWYPRRRKIIHVLRARRKKRQPHREAVKVKICIGEKCYFVPLRLSHNEQMHLIINMRVKIGDIRAHGFVKKLTNEVPLPVHDEIGQVASLLRVEHQIELYQVCDRTWSYMDAPWLRRTARREAAAVRSGRARETKAGYSPAHLSVFININSAAAAAAAAARSSPVRRLAFKGAPLAAATAVSRAYARRDVQATAVMRDHHVCLERPVETLLRTTRAACVVYAMRKREKVMYNTDEDAAWWPRNSKSKRKGREKKL